MYRSIRASAPFGPARCLTALALVTALSACSSSSDDPVGTGGGGGDGPGTPGDGLGTPGNPGNPGNPGDPADPGNPGNPGNPAPVITGDIARFGVVNVADEAGTASDAIAVFNRVSPGVGEQAFGTAADPAGAPCEVVPSGSNGNDLLLVGFAPTARGAQSTSILAGDTVSLTFSGGTWTTLTADPANVVSFYDGMVPDGAVPAALQADVSASPDADGFPAFTMATLPGVSALTGFTVSPAGAISPGSTFAWDADADPASRVRIVASTGFFGDAENGRRVSCLVPDTGSFSFPADTQAALGGEFQGELLVSSRLSIGTRQEGDTLLFLVRESFTAE